MEGTDELLSSQYDVRYVRYWSSFPGVNSVRARASWSRVVVENDAAVNKKIRGIRSPLAGKKHCNNPISELNDGAKMVWKQNASKASASRMMAVDEPYL